MDEFLRTRSEQRTAVAAQRHDVSAVLRDGGPCPSPWLTGRKSTAKRSGRHLIKILIADFSYLVFGLALYLSSNSPKLHLVGFLKLRLHARSRRRRRFRNPGVINSVHLRLVIDVVEPDLHTHDMMFIGLAFCQEVVQILQRVFGLLSNILTLIFTNNATGVDHTILRQNRMGMIKRKKYSNEQQQRSRESRRRSFEVLDPRIRFCWMYS